MSTKTKTTVPKEEATLALVPKLRFPEFRDADGWQATILGELSEVVRGGSPRPIDGYLTNAADGLSWLKIGDVDKEAKFVTKTAEKVRPEALSKTRVVHPGDLILSNSMSFGRPYILQIKTCIHDGWIAITRIAEETERDFLYYLISAPSSQSYFVDNAAGSGVQNLNADIIKDLKVCFPSRSEQQKIAECLSSMDELMAAQARKVDALKTHKKGLMQQLFPREGETQPRLRFPEFQNHGEWEGGDLGSKTTKVGSGITPNGGDKNYKRSGRPFVRSQNVGWGELILDDVAFIDEETHSSFCSTEIQVFDVLLNITGASIGRSAIADGRVTSGNVNQHVCIIRVKATELNHFYLSQYLISQEGQKQIDSFQAGGNRQGLNFAQIRSFTIPLPPKVSEQQRIAACLNSVDYLIAAQTQRLEALKTHKKGLMQQLFPVAGVEA
jgi:type I restriction enzyme, S subunit